MVNYQNPECHWCERQIEDDETVYYCGVCGTALCCDCVHAIDDGEDACEDCYLEKEGE